MRVLVPLRIATKFRPVRASMKKRTPSPKKISSTHLSAPDHGHGAVVDVGRLDEVIALGEV